MQHSEGVWGGKLAQKPRGLKLFSFGFKDTPLLITRNGAERIYFFSQLAIEMNEPEEGVAPTDSRNRPDQRLMEEGKWDEANHMKILLEEKQRAARRQREQEIEKAKNEGKKKKKRELFLHIFL